jgi:hypothetical protein
MMSKSHLNAAHRVASRLVRSVVLTGLVVLGTLLARPVDAQQRVFGSATVPYGQSYSGWTADWLRFVFDHTFEDLASEPHCRPSGVHSRVWFITPLFSPGETVVTCQLPPGVSLLLPLLWAECSTVEDPGPFGCSDEASCRACAEAFIDGASGLSATIDGTLVDVSRFRFGSPLISYNLPDSNIFGLSDGTPIQSVGDGYYLMIKPLSVGQHVVRHTGGSADLGFFNTTVRVQVAP